MNTKDFSGYPLPKIAKCKPNLDFSQHKRILVAGAGSYIGQSFIEHMSQFRNYEVDDIKTTDSDWKKADFSKYDAVYDVAGIAHIKETSENKHLYYEVNRDLAVELAKKAKEEGVKQFIYLSSMSVYGLTVGSIHGDTPVNPINAYGKSKLEAEQLLWQLNDENFTVSIVRPPMVYGEGCKGNYQTLKKFALKFGFFPNYNNERSMLNVDNLSAAIRSIIHNNESGLYFPQDPEYVKTYDMVKKIAEENGKEFRSTKLMNLPIKIAASKVGVFKKVFGTLTYDKSMNVPEEWLGEVMKDEQRTINTKNKKLLVLMSTYNGEKYLQKQLESIISQKTEAEIMIRIRDDGSSDNTCNIIKELQERYPNTIELIRGDNIGSNASFFELLNGASGYDYYAISDQDDIWLEDKLDVAIKRIQESNDSGAILYASTSYLVMDDLVPYGTTRKKVKDFSIYNTLIQNICPGHTQVFNNELLSKVQGNIDVNQIYVYDAWITNVAMLYGKIIFDNESHTYYRQHSGNQLGSGSGRVGQLLSSAAKSDKGHGKKYRQQVAYFLKQNEAELKAQGCYNEVHSFVDATSIRKRAIYCMSSKLYRQSLVETVVFKCAILFGKF